jgi:hypothetical protein
LLLEDRSYRLCFGSSLDPEGSWLLPGSTRRNGCGVAHAFRAVDLWFRGPLAGCAPGRVRRKLRLPTALARSGSDLPSGFAGSCRGRSLSSTTCSVGSDGVFQPVSFPSPAPEGAGCPVCDPKVTLRGASSQRFAKLPGPKTFQLRETPRSGGFEGPKTFESH